MKILKYLFFLFLIIIIGASVYIATKNGSYQVERQQMIAAPQEVIYDEVNDFTTWQDWEAWSKNNEDLIVNYGEVTSGDGASFSYKSDDSGEGEIITTKAVPHTRIDQEITMNNTFGKSTSEMYWTFEEKNDSTLVTWGFKGDQTFMEKASFLFQDQSISEMMKPKFEKGLNNLEAEIRKEMESYTINVDGITQHGGGYYMYITTASKISQVTDRMEKMTSEVGNYMTSNNIEIIGKPFILYNEWNEDRGTAIYSAAYFTPSEVVTPQESSVLNGFMPNQKTLKTTLNGDYDNLQEAWDKAYAYITSNGLSVSEESEGFEVYVVGPKDNANPAEWITNIYIPLGEPKTLTDENPEKDD